MSDTTESKTKEKKLSTRLRHRFIWALIAVLATLVVAVTATFAWYIYNTSAHTTNVHMAAGTSTQLEIANSYEGTYGYSVQLDSFVGTLNPVSTDKITNGFQKVMGYTDGSDTRSMLANLFGKAESSDYFTTTLYLRSNAPTQGIYISGITYEQNADAELLATAARIGFVIHEPGNGQAVQAQYIFSLSDAKNPNAEYNTYNGHEGCVLDSTKTDGSVVEFTPYSQKNYASYSSETGITTIGSDALKLFDLAGGDNYTYGTPVQIDVYVWLEGCDEDCTGSLGSLSLKNLAVSFAGYTE